MKILLKIYLDYGKKNILSDNFLVATLPWMLARDNCSTFYPED